MMILHYKKSAFSLSEIMITVCVVVIVALPILYMTTSSRKDTTHAINYLRAIELGNEILDWVNCLRYEQITTDTFINSGLCESLTEDSSGSLSCKTLSVTNTSANDTWKNTAQFLADGNEVKYPDQYAKQYFYRDVEINEIEDKGIKEVIVTVSWAESFKPKNIHDGKDRNKSITLSTVVLRDRDFAISSLEN